MTVKKKKKLVKTTRKEISYLTHKLPVNFKKYKFQTNIAKLYLGLYTFNNVVDR